MKQKVSNISTYIKKPIPVQALHYIDDSELKEWVGSSLIEQDGKFFIKTLEGNMEVKRDSYVVKGIEDEFWSVQKSIFEKTYQKV